MIQSLKEIMNKNGEIKINDKFWDQQNKIKIFDKQNKFGVEIKKGPKIIFLKQIIKELEGIKISYLKIILYSPFKNHILE